MATITGTNAGDIRNGTDNADKIYGLDGADLLFGRGGNDTLAGQAGDDFLVGGAGADTLLGGSGIDTASYFDATSGVEVTLAQGHGFGGDAQGDILAFIENLSGSSWNDILTGNGLVNRLYGNGGDDFIDGGAGNDELFGGAGVDMLVGGSGADGLYGGAGGIDSVSYLHASAGIVASLTDGGSAGEAAGDSYGGIENLIGSNLDDTLTGDGAANHLASAGGNDTLGGAGGDDILSGGIGNDALFGDEDADRLAGDAGVDLMTGGVGADRFIFYAATDSGVAGGNRDRITDFSHAEGDKIDISGLVFDPLDFIGTAGFSGAGQVRYNHQDGNTIIRINLEGSTGSEMEIRLDGTHNLTADDLLL
jgi:Ca2+-binding RTX toxin-like protein